MSSTRHIAISRLTKERIIVKTYNSLLIIGNYKQLPQRTTSIVRTGEEEKSRRGHEVGEEEKTIEASKGGRDRNMSGG